MIWEKTTLWELPPDFFSAPQLMLPIKRFDRLATHRTDLPRSVIQICFWSLRSCHCHWLWLGPPPYTIWLELSLETRSFSLSLNVEAALETLVSWHRLTLKPLELYFEEVTFDLGISRHKHTIRNWLGHTLEMVNGKEEKLCADRLLSCWVGGAWK